MIRKETKMDGGKAVSYIVKDDINVSVIISELSAMGCKGEELGEAYRTLMSDDKGYLYENKETKETLLVVDENSLGKGYAAPFVWLFFMTALFGGMPFGDPRDGFIQELKKGGEEIK